MRHFSLASGIHETPSALETPAGPDVLMLPAGVS